MSQLQIALLSTAIALVSVVIAAAALRQAKRAQRENYDLALKVANLSGRLQSIKPSWHMIPRPPLESGPAWSRGPFSYKVTNGATEVTVTSAELQIRYISSKGLGVFGEEEFIFRVRSDDFELMGIKGPKFNFRLRPYDVAEWTFPSGLFDREDLLHERSGQHREIQFRFAVTASGDTLISEPYSIGGPVEPVYRNKYRRHTDWGADLNRVVFATLIHGTGLDDDNILLIAIPAKRISYYRSVHIPDGLLDWLANVAEQALGRRLEDNDSAPA